VCLAPIQAVGNSPNTTFTNANALQGLGNFAVLRSIDCHVINGKHLLKRGER
jgi:hypothetical protein